MDKTIIIQQIAGCSYMRQQDLAEKYGISKTTVHDRVREIMEETGYGKRYRRQSVIEDGNIVLVNEYVFLDWLSVRKLMRNSSTRKYVEAFSAGDWAEYLGTHTVSISEEKDRQMEKARRNRMREVAPAAAAVSGE